MRRVRMRSSEVTVEEPAERLVARIPATFTVSGTRFRRGATDRPQPVTAGVVARRFEGSWERGRRAGRWWVDVLPATRTRALLTVVILGGGHPGGLAFEVARTIRAISDCPRVHDRADPDELGPRSVPMWETA